MISVIIPTFNRCFFIGATLESLICQTFKNWECIVVDDESIDYTKELLEFYCEKDSRIKYYKRPSYLPKGANACRNYGFSASQGDLICWFDSDDIMSPVFLERHLNSFVEKKVNLSLCNSIIFEEGSEKQTKRPNLFPGYSLRDQHIMLKRNILTPEAVWRRSFFKDHTEIFDTKLNAAQEWEFYASWLEDRVDYSYLDHPMVFIRKHENNITYGSETNCRTWNYFLARLKVYTNPSLSLDREVRDYLKVYLLGSFKNAVWKGNFSLAFKMYQKFVFKEDFSIAQKLRAILAILSFKLFKRGSFLLQKI